MSLTVAVCYAYPSGCTALVDPLQPATDLGSAVITQTFKPGQDHWEPALYN